MSTTSEVRIPEAARREKTVATCEVCKRPMSASDLSRHHAHRVVDGHRTITRWECIGHEGLTRDPVVLTDAAPADPSKSSRYVMDLSAARGINQTIAKVAPNLVKARADNDDTIKRLTRIAGSAGGDALKSMRARLGLGGESTEADTMREFCRAISEDFAKLSSSPHLDAIELSITIECARETFSVAEQAFGISSGGGK